MSRSRRYLTTAEAVAALGVSPATLYAYVSRGRVRRVRDSADPHVSRYSASDVEALRRQKEARRFPDLAARKTLDWGLPVLESAITRIQDGRLYYRGHDVASLVAKATFEQVVQLLWHGEMTAAGERFPATAHLGPLLRQVAMLPPVPRLQGLLPRLGARDRRAFSGSRADVIAGGRRIVAASPAAVTGARASGRRIAERLALGWKRNDPAVVRALDLALSACADHELNASTFAVRVVASTGGSLYDAVAAGLAALRGPRHGGDTRLVEVLLDETGTPRRLAGLLARRARSGASTSGFEHPLYPDGDPRARLMIEAVVGEWPDSPAAAIARALESARAEGRAGSPNVDFGLVLLRRAAGLPRSAALSLFALGRMAGWIAHALEQYERPDIIRPRASYSGPPPGIDS